MVGGREGRKERDRMREDTDAETVRERDGVRERERGRGMKERKRHIMRKDR